MSSQPPSNQTTGNSKSAAKKRSKKATGAAAPTSSLPHPITAAAGEIHFDYSPLPPGQAGAPPLHLPPLPPQAFGTEPPVFSFATTTGQFPPDFKLDGKARSIYTDPTNPADTTSQSTPFSLPFPFDYSGFGSSTGTGDQRAAGGISGLNITHEDLIQTANELYRRMADPNFGNDDAYWSSLPAHLRQFIREAVPMNPNANPPAQLRGVSEGQQGMWTMAQQIVNAASKGMGLGPGVGANLLAGVNGRQYAQPNGAIGEELGFRRHPDAAREEEYDEEEEFDLDEPAYATAPDAPKKKNKKKKKKAAVVEPPPASLPPPAVKQPPRQPIPPNPPVHQHHQQPPTLHPPPPPATPAPAHPPPSSRAAGKQPMSNAPANQQQPPARSARAAGKAPASTNHNHHHNHPPPNKPAAKGKAPANQPPAKIWTQSSLQDRENIRQFWLSLTEAERRDLLQIEKDAVLRKMKEQHRHSCGCAVCGRKKVNIESELEQLYEQYYDELRHYAAEQRAAANGRQHPPPGAGPFPGSVEVDASGQVTKLDHRAPDHAYSPQEDIIDDGSEDYDDEEYDDEEDLEDDELGSEEGDPEADDLDEVNPPPQPPSHRPAKPMPKSAAAAAPRPAGTDDFMGFGNSLATIKGGILTVADDLLKNDGAKFLEMMEQLAVARSVREEQNIRDLQDETEDDYDDKDEPISEAERLEEGKRMFQIFAARMFEQRVLQAYRERVAKEREEQLLRELEQEDDAKRQREEKKASQSQKKKDKKKQQKQKADEEKAAREAAAAAEIEAAKAKAEQAERDRQKRAEEERLRREAVKKAAAEEQARIVAERKKRQQEEKEREEEAAKKKREREEKARKEREQREREAKEQERRDKEERLAKEKAEKAEKDRLAKERAEKDRLAKEAKEKAEKERLAKLEEEKARKDEEARKEREAAEQAKAQRERAKAEKAEKAAQQAAAVKPVQPVPVRARAPSRNGNQASTDSPVKAGPLPAGRTPVRPQQKTPQPYFPQPVASPAYSSRVPAQSLAPGFRPTPGFPTAAAFSPPSATNGLISPNPPNRGYAPDPSPPFDLAQRTAPIGMGFPPAKSARLASMDEPFSPPPPIGSLPGRTASSDLDEFRSNPAPIAPPGPIGRPSASFLESPMPTSSSSRSKSGQPEPVFGSAALGADDEIVQPARRNISNGWEVPVSAAPGAGRWSTSPAASIWGNSTGGDPAWAQPPARQPSFGGIGASAPFGSIFGGAPGTQPQIPVAGVTNHLSLSQHSQHSQHSQQQQQHNPHSHH